MNRKSPQDAQQVYERYLKGQLRRLEEEKWKRNEAFDEETTGKRMHHGVVHSDFDGREISGQQGGLNGALAWGALNWASLEKALADTFLYPGQAAGKDAKYYAEIGKEYDIMLRHSLMRSYPEYLKSPGFMQQEARGSDPVTAWDTGLRKMHRLVIGEGEFDPEKTKRTAAGLSVRAVAEHTLPKVEKTLLAAGVRGAAGLAQTSPFIGFATTYLTSDKVDLPDQIFALEMTLKTMDMYRKVATARGIALGDGFDEEYQNISHDMKQLQLLFDGNIYETDPATYQYKRFEFNRHLKQEEYRLLGKPQ